MNILIFVEIFFKKVNVLSEETSAHSDIKCMNVKSLLISHFAVLTVLLLLV